mgnify:CR=1 FL=1
MFLYDTTLVLKPINRGQAAWLNEGLRLVNISRRNSTLPFRSVHAQFEGARFKMAECLSELLNGAISLEEIEQVLTFGRTRVRVTQSVL